MLSLCRIFSFTALFFTLPLFAQYVNYQIDGANYQGFISKKSESAPTVIIVHDWDGLTEYEIKRASMLESLGYSVFLVDMFGKGVRPTKVEDKKRLTSSLYKDRKKMNLLFSSGVAQAQKMGLNTKNAVAAGYCFGGTVILESARTGFDLKGFVSFHGGLKTPDGESYKKARGQYLILHGGADKAVTMSDFANLSGELEAAKLPNQMVSFGGADHAFTVFGGSRFDKNADTKSWSMFKQFLSEVTS